MLLYFVYDQINQVPFDEFTHVRPVAHSATSASDGTDLVIANRMYLQQMASSGQWGDGVMLAAASRLYQRHIVVVMSTSTSTNNDASTDVHFTTPEVTTGPPVFMGYVSANHYVFLQPAVTYCEPVPLSTPQQTASGFTSDLRGNRKCRYTVLNLQSLPAFVTVLACHRITTHALPMP